MTASNDDAPAGPGEGVKDHIALSTRQQVNTGIAAAMAALYGRHRPLSPAELAVFQSLRAKELAKAEARGRQAPPQLELEVRP